MDDIWEAYVKTFHRTIDAKSKTDKHIRFDNGVPLRFFTLDNYDSVRPFQFGIHIYDEAAFSPYLREAQQGAIMATGFRYRADEWYLSTPNGYNYFKEICDLAERLPDRRYFHYTSYDNPYLPIDMLDRYKETMPSVMFRQEVMAEFVDMAGNRIKREWIRYDSAPEGCVISIGVDLAISMKTQADYSTMVVVASKDGKHWVVDVVRKKESFDAVKTTIINLADKWKPSVISIESVAYQAAMIQELVRTTNLPIKSIKPHKDKITRFLTIEGKYEHGYVYHSPNLIPEFEQELLSFPNGSHDDMCDALVYALSKRESAIYF